MSVRTRHDDIRQNEVLWVTPEVCRLPALPGGFALCLDVEPRNVDPHRAVWRGGWL